MINHDDADKSVEATRLHAVERIHQEEMDRIEAVLAGYELEKANAKFAVLEFCKRYGANHVAAWVLADAESLGQSL